MGLKNCADCGTEISTRAVTCPKCGAPQKKPIIRRFIHEAVCNNRWIAHWVIFSIVISAILVIPIQAIANHIEVNPITMLIAGIFGLGIFTGRGTPETCGEGGAGV